MRIDPGSLRHPFPVVNSIPRPTSHPLPAISGVTRGSYIPAVDVENSGGDHPPRSQRRAKVSPIRLAYSTSGVQVAWIAAQASRISAGVGSRRREERFPRRFLFPVAGFAGFVASFFVAAIIGYPFPLAEIC